jgi:hypothetical protein
MPKSEAAGISGVRRPSIKRCAAARPEEAPRGSKPKLDERASKLLESDIEEGFAVTLKDRCQVGTTSLMVMMGNLSAHKGSRIREWNVERS